MNIVEFLKARLAEDEAVARAIDDKQLDSGWSTSYNQFGLANTPPGWYITPHIGLAYEEEGARHIARFNPERVLREIAAKRRIVEDYRISRSADLEQPDSRGTLHAGAEAFFSACISLASAYSDHPDHTPSWTE